MDDHIIELFWKCILVFNTESNNHTSFQWHNLSAGAGSSCFLRSDLKSYFRTINSVGKWKLISSIAGAKWKWRSKATGCPSLAHIIIAKYFGLTEVRARLARHGDMHAQKSSSLVRLFSKVGSIVTYIIWYNYSILWWVSIVI